MDTSITQPEEALDAVRALIREGDFKSASSALDPILTDAPRLGEALYMKAVCARYLRDFADALSWLDKLRSVEPEYGRAYQEEGHVRLAQGDPGRALAAYRRACQFNPSLAASWQRQAEILAHTGNEDEARQVAMQAQWLMTLPRELVAAMNHIHEGRLFKGEQLCRAFLQQNPTNVEGMRLLADIGARMNVLDEAAFLLDSAVAFEPNHVRARFDYIQVLRRQQRYEAALEQAKMLYQQDPLNPAFQSHLAIESMHNNDFEQAFALFDQVLEKLPGDPATLTSRGHALKTFGRHEDAVESYRGAYRTEAGFGDAWFGLANLKTYRFTDEEQQIMLREEASDRLSYNARVQVCFSLGKAFEDSGDYAEAFRFYEKGNTLKRVLSRYDADQMTEELAAQHRVCTADLFKKKVGMGHKAPDPIFILGLPRAGSTLLEQIIASHSQVDGTLELPNVLSLAHRLRRQHRDDDESAYPAVLHDLTAEQLESFGAKYIEDTAMFRQGAPFFIDKMPNNFRHIGLIKLMLPNAKIIDARRAPMDCCFSGFKQLFAEGQEFTYGLEQVGRYYHDYVHLMRHWHDVLPGQILHVQYEDVVADTEAQVHRILEYLGLPFEDACLAFHKTKRVVRTASSEQVRQPINTKGLEAWKPFEQWLDPLKAALDDVLEDYRC
ncbi:MAG: tetratricopeptide repeat-containing sulfotransferase family protein [Novosphingobium sp.]|uniref:tetratricopeptide repeat-containing sulfotransferase family protein n=1 Tax=Novosphingobium sp. TaxID=1874826 RepID=UPI003B99AAEC